MLDIKFVYDNRDLVRENIKKKFQDQKLPLVDEVCNVYDEKRKIQLAADNLRQNRNKLSKEIGALMGKGQKDEAEKLKEQVRKEGEELVSWWLYEEVDKIIHGPDGTETNVEDIDDLYSYLETRIF